MHKFLRTVGFSNYKKKHDIEKLLQDLIDQIDPSQIHKIQIDEETNLCQVRAEMAHDMGLDIYGEMDEFGVVRPEYYVPYMLSHDSSSTADCSIQRHTDRETFAGLLDENRVGISLIFYMENAMEYREKRMNKENLDVDHVNLMGLSSGGKILLPIKKTAKQVQMAKVALKERVDLIEAAKNGDEDAMETLTVDDIDMYSQIIYFLFRKRIDLFFYTQNIPNHGILVAFNPTRHKTGIYDRINVLFLDSSGDLGIHINVIYGQSLHGVFIAVFCSLN